MAISDIDKLRLLLGERIPAGGAATDTFFSDDELTMLIEASQYGINGAAVLGWATKAGEYARLIDIAESGGDRKLSQRYRQALTQLQFFQARVEQDIAVATTSGRVAGKSINWARQCGNNAFVHYTKQYNRMTIFEAAALINPGNTVDITDALYDANSTVV